MGIQNHSYIRSFLIGVTFAVAWSPCVGPILGVALTFAATSGTAIQGGILLLSYAAGLGIWFILIALFFEWLMPRLKSTQTKIKFINISGAIVFISMGLLLFFNEFSRLNNYLLSYDSVLSNTFSMESNLSMSIDNFFGPFIAFLGGMLSFFSPCVLPLVPVYLINIAGESAIDNNLPLNIRSQVVRHACSFVMGFAVIFALMGASIGLVGNSIQQNIPLFTRIGGVLLVLFGLQMTGIIKIPYLDRDYRIF
tara:strand:+ start:6967 stop:7722 length:756 start_codon:yes stop_codon:yes gene_type:complete